MSLEAPVKPIEIGPSRRATIRDVAAAAGLSVGTVSRVMNGHASVTEEARSRVREAVSLLNYAPDSAAQSLRSRQTKVIGCLVPIAAHPVFAEVVAAAEAVLRPAGYAMVLGSTTDRVSHEAELLSFFHGRRVDGLIATLAREDDPSIRLRLKALGCPIVLLDRALEDDFDAVFTDQGAGCHEAASLLIGLGHRRIALVTSSLHSRPGRERERHFRRAFAEHGMRPDERLIRTVASPADFGFHESAALLSEAAPPTAIIAGVHELVGLMRAVRVRGMRVPDDLSIVAFGDSDLAELAEPAITVVRWDAGEVGRVAAQLILERIVSGADLPAREVLFPTKLTIRQSCGAPKDRDVRFFRDFAEK
jgi:LacI family transcriptional regulator